MPINAKNKPGCPCCQCECANGTLYPKFTRIKVVISGLQASYDYLFEAPTADVNVLGRYRGTLSGLDGCNGSWFFDIDHTEANCIYDDPENPTQSPVIQEVEITNEWTLEDAYYSDCSGSATPTSDSETIYAAIGLGKLQASYFLADITLTTVWSGQLRGCQVVACENDFNPTQNGSLNPIPKNTLPNGPNTSAQHCSNGKIWLAVARYDPNLETGDPFICGDYEVEGASYIEAGTISVELLA